MDNSRLYQKFNSLQRAAASEIINELIHLLENEVSSLLDIGCGPGDVLIEVIAPKLPKGCKIVGIDISAEMVESAKKNFGSENVEFHRSDISAEFEDCVKNLREDQRLFDVITSFYCFHWVQNQKRALKNVSKLLKPNGSILMFFLVSTEVFDIYAKLSTFKCYQDYMRDYKNFISPYHRVANPMRLFKKNFSAAGLKAKHLEIREQCFIYKNDDEFLNSMMAVNPFVKRLPDNLKNQFTQDYLTVFKKMTNNENMKRGSEVIACFDLMVAVLVK